MNPIKNLCYSLIFQKIGHDEFKLALIHEIIGKNKDECVQIAQALVDAKEQGEG